MAANYERLVRECQAAADFMRMHFAGVAPSLREYCDDNDLTYLRMINRTYPLKKVSEAECNRILAAALADYQGKLVGGGGRRANGQVRRAPGGGRTPATPPVQRPATNQVLISVEEYRRLVHLAQEDREKQFRTYNNLRKDFNEVLREAGRPQEGCMIQPPQPLPVLTTKAEVEAHLKRQVERYNRLHPEAVPPSTPVAQPPLLQLEDGEAEEAEDDESDGRATFYVDAGSEGSEAEEEQEQEDEE